MGCNCKWCNKQYSPVPQTVCTIFPKSCTDHNFPRKARMQPHGEQNWLHSPVTSGSKAEQNFPGAPLMHSPLVQNYYGTKKTQNCGTSSKTAVLYHLQNCGSSTEELPSNCGTILKTVAFLLLPRGSNHAIPKSGLSSSLISSPGAALGPGQRQGQAPGRGPGAPRASRAPNGWQTVLPLESRSTGEAPNAASESSGTSGTASHRARL